MRTTTMTHGGSDDGIGGYARACVQGELMVNLGAHGFKGRRAAACSAEREAGR